MSEATTTVDHATIRRWVEERRGSPATVKGTAPAGDAGLLRIDFPGSSQESLAKIDWDDFFDKFEEQNLAFLYQEQSDDGETSYFCKFVERES